MRPRGKCILSIKYIVRLQEFWFLLKPLVVLFFLQCLVLTLRGTKRRGRKDKIITTLNDLKKDLNQARNVAEIMVSMPGMGETLGSIPDMAHLNPHYCMVCASYL